MFYKKPIISDGLNEHLSLRAVSQERPLNMAAMELVNNEKENASRRLPGGEQPGSSEVQEGSQDRVMHRAYALLCVHTE